MFFRLISFGKSMRALFVCGALVSVCPYAAHAGPQPPIVQQNMMQGGGSANLTAFSGNIGAMNNNQWNAMMNVGKGTAAANAPTADFGNCNAVIIRCASPKCGTTGCTDANVAMAIANGCVAADSNCKQYGTDLVNAIAAQLVATSTANANAQNAQATAMAAQAAAAAGTQQMQAMQDQMQQMQQQMQAAQADSDAKIQAALAAQAQQQQAAATAAAAAPAAATDTNVTGTAPMTDVAQAVAAKSGIDVNVLLREQASGQILSKLDDVKASLANTNAAMIDAFTYAGCDDNGTGCTGPRRVAAFKAKANKFFDPYIETLQEVKDAVIYAQALGVDLTDIYAMLNDSCSIWGKFLCGPGQVMRYSSVDPEACKQMLIRNPGLVDTTKCAATKDMVGKLVPMNEGGCQPLGALDNTTAIQQNWIYPDQTGNSQPCTMADLANANGNCVPTAWDPKTGAAISGYKAGTGATGVQVGCLSDIVATSGIFKVLNRQTTIGVDQLQQVLGTDYTPNANTGPDPNLMQCNVGQPLYGDPVNVLQTLVNSRRPNLAALDASGAGTAATSGTTTTGGLNYSIDANGNLVDNNMVRDSATGMMRYKTLAEQMADASGLNAIQKQEAKATQNVVQNMCVQSCLATGGAPSFDGTKCDCSVSPGGVPISLGSCLCAPGPSKTPSPAVSPSKSLTDCESNCDNGRCKQSAAECNKCYLEECGIK